MKKTYITKSPSVIAPDWIARPPKTMNSVPMTPSRAVEPAVTAEIPVSVVRMFANSRSTPRLKTRSSSASAV
ncbi:hypothetical protein D3C83_231650 [compost metagenome]